VFPAKNAPSARPKITYPSLAARSCAAHVSVQFRPLTKKSGQVISMKTTSTTRTYLIPLVKLIFIAAAAAALSVIIDSLALRTAHAANGPVPATDFAQQPTAPKTKAPLSSVKVAAPKPGAKITEADVNAAQQAWCDALVNIGKVHAEGGDYRSVADQAISNLY